MAVLLANPAKGEFNTKDILKKIGGNWLTRSLGKSNDLLLTTNIQVDAIKRYVKTYLEPIVNKFESAPRSITPEIRATLDRVPDLIKRQELLGTKVKSLLDNYRNLVTNPTKSETDKFAKSVTELESERYFLEHEIPVFSMKLYELFSLTEKAAFAKPPERIEETREVFTPLATSIDFGALKEFVPGSQEQKPGLG